MPEIITKYPDIVLEILREAGAECGTGAPQQILTACPPERFCSLPTGEICVYGLNEVSQMTQITAQELSISPIFAIPLALAAFAAGIVIGILLHKKIAKKLK